MRAELPTGTVTFLFTDIEGSTRLLHALGPEAYAGALAEHRRVLREAFAAHDGIEVDTQGDAFFVAFPTATGAAAAALAGRDALEAGPIRVRMGLHTGEPTVTSEGYVGIDVHRGARVAALANGGQVLLTEATAQLLDAHLTDLGRHRLKDFDGPARLLQLGTRSFPPLRTPGTVILPTPATRFLGRERELHTAVELVLTGDPAIVTILGPGGTGKTRFALELARQLAEDADGGTLFVPLATVLDPELVLPTVAEAVGAESAEPSAIARRVGDKRTHLVIDNLEQLLPGAARSLAALVAASPALRLLVTSREALGVAAETRFELPPLNSNEAVELFLARAHAVRPGLAPSPAVTTLCERLDRLPLALELAAARTRLIAPDVLLERLSERLDLPAPRDADPRHATLRATIAWSHDLLTEREQQLFSALSVFRGGATLAAAEAVSDADLDTLASLLDKSLLRRRTDRNGEERYWMLETIGEFAATRLGENPERRQQLHRRHAEWIHALALAAGLSVEQIARGRPPDYARMLAERDDMRQAIDWSIAQAVPLAIELLTALELFWVTSALLEGQQYVERVMTVSADLPDLVRARLLRLLGGLIIPTGQVERGEAGFREALEIFRAHGDEMSVVDLRARLVMRVGSDGDPHEARRLVAEVRAANEAVGNPLVEPLLLTTLGEAERREGNLEGAREHFRRSADLAKERGFVLWNLWQLLSLVHVELQLDMLDDAERSGQEGLALARRLEDDRLETWFVTYLALAALERNDDRRAGMLWGAVVSAREEARTVWQDDSGTALPLSDCTRPEFLEAVGEGRLLTFDGGVELALGERPTQA